MARNANLPLTLDEAATVAHWSEPLWTLAGSDKEVTLYYVKADGTSSSAHGAILADVKGLDSTLAVTVDTMATKGRTSCVNVRNVRGIAY